ncbi:CLUMA_CG014778, isoform A [Clunio marinus]|uniref:CLUMA_CG014778, isoform A n=1 Tax=Clunio marinus TaxID=568069 RepID=A0A1J1INL7_9DIPT|nr:CLUMA_CG014778, isoform A [Clunio marinus]
MVANATKRCQRLCEPANNNAVNEKLLKVCNRDRWLKKLGLLSDADVGFKTLTDLCSLKAITINIKHWRIKQSFFLIFII